MQFFSNIHIPELQPAITYNDAVMLTGSCFTEHIGNHLKNVKFQVLQNPNGILFDPISVCNSLVSYVDNKKYTEADLFYLNEAWHSWNHHSRFSGTNKEDTLAQINASQQAAHTFLKNTKWLIITLGSAFSYRLTENNYPVANCHKAPTQTFQKHLCTIEEIISAFDLTIFRLFQFNPDLRILFTISPVRHLRDGVVENNRSKARLIEAVHHLVNKFDKLYYFPAYELVIDVLRDYRFYDADLAHPNYAATTFVLENFSEKCMDKETQEWAEKFRKLTIAKNHRPFNAQSVQHKKFLHNHFIQTREYSERFPHLDFSDELNYFAAH